MTQSVTLAKLFGSKSRVAVLQLLLENPQKKFKVNEVIKKSGVNARLASSELKKLAEIGIFVSRPSGNRLLYQIDETSPYVKPLQQIFAKHDWLEWERPSRIHHLVLTLEAGLKPMKEYYGHSLPYSHLVFNYDNVTWFFKLSDWQALGKKLIPIYEKRKGEIWDDFEKFAGDLWDCKNYRSFFKNYFNFWKVAYITEPISFYIDAQLNPGEQISIEDKSFTDEYEDKIWKLAKQAEKIGLDKIDVQPILKDYFWIRNSYHGIHRLTEEEIGTEIRKKIGKKRPLPQKIKDPPSLSKKLLKIGKEMVLMQDIRKKYMMKAAYFLHEFLKEIGKKYNLPPVMMAQSLPGEVLRIGQKMPKLKEELKLRQRSCTVTGSLTEGIKVYSGEIFFPQGVQRRAKFEIRGRVACGGKAVGGVRIVNRAEEIFKVNHGDVIVAPMTSPDFMPAIRRCVAIVTNFGGITCHAAIVSREFNIPCILSTNNATEVLQDGDLIEVDADSGVVKVLQSRE